MYSFEHIRRSEIEPEQKFEEVKEDLQVNIYDLFFQGLLEQTEVLILLKKIAAANNLDGLREIKKEFFDSEAAFVYEEGEMFFEFTGIENFKIFFDKALENIEVSNWQEKFISLLKKISHCYIHPYHEILIKAWLAIFLEQVYQCHVTENMDIQVFGNQLERILAEFDLPAFLKIGKGTDLGKRKPSFTESVEGTLERLNKIEELKKLLKNFSDSIIVGGSMSYGPFFNIRKTLDETGSSDIDLIVILDEEQFNSSQSESLQNSGIIREDEKDLFFSRMNKFRNLYSTREADVFTQQFHMQGTDFDISAHFFTPPYSLK